MLEWLSHWTPEHVIGFITALGILLGAATLHGKSKSSESNSSVDTEGTVFNTRLVSSDRMKLEEIIDALGFIRRIVRQMEEDLEVLHTHQVSTKSVIDKIFKTVGEPDYEEVQT